MKITMSSIEGLPTRGSVATIWIKKVHLHPFCVLVEFWGKFCEFRTADYECLAREIQSPGKLFRETEGSPGDQCLVKIESTWYRSRIVTRNGSRCDVFLIDKGISYSTLTSNLAWGKEKHFALPSEVEHCVLANVLPFSPENRWSPVALEFLKTLPGKSVRAHVQDVLVQQRTFLLHIECIAKQMYEMGMAKKMAPDMFHDFVCMSHTGVDVSSETLQISTEASEWLRKEVVFMYPELSEGTVETVIVTEVATPQRIFCQLKVFSKELKKLTEQITKRYEGRTSSHVLSPKMIGFPCAAKGRDGKWYRSTLQQVFPTCGVVEVLNVDFGTKEFVHMANVRPLDAEFFRMPVVTYLCSLYGITEKGVGWTNNQVEYLISLLLYKTVIVKFEYQSSSDGVHYVTLCGDENANVNSFFSSKESCLLDCEEKLEDFTIQSSAPSHNTAAQQERNLIKCSSHVEEDQVEKVRVEKLPVEEMPLSSAHVAVVQHVTDPSEFWIQTQNYANEFDELMEGINHLCKGSSNNYMRNPTVGLYCAAKAEDGDFYRATVAEVTETQVKVFFVDYGNTDMVDRCDIRTLPDQFKKLPCLALKCTLAGVKPTDGRWNQSSCKYFNKAVTDKTLNVHVIAKSEESYAVQLVDPKAEGEKDVGALMCSCGLAERTEMQRQSKAKKTMQPAVLGNSQRPDARSSSAFSNSERPFQPLNTFSLSGDERRVSAFKEQMFTIGSVLDVTVSHIESPNDFWCQLAQNTRHLKILMHNLQSYYESSQFEPFTETCCVARHPRNGMWYRALVIRRHETQHADVLFVDYGKTETVSCYDLRRICADFLMLPGQAFRCRLLNPADPTSAPNIWNEEAIAKFHRFVDTATSKLIVLKCTIYAIMCSEQKTVFNIVALETPFECVATSMINLVKASSPMTTTGPSFHLDTYYYSAHNVKVGTEEKVLVTYVKSVGQFYCHLERNADVIKDLKEKVSSICHKLTSVQVPTLFGALCFAKYADGQWYRAQIKATKPVIKVHFVDYGDTIEVEESDLLPVPKEANDIMSVPVQAVVCGLSDIPVDVCSEADRWFETNATECKFQALIVAREPDGKLLVELYCGKTQINSKLKKTFQIEMLRQKPILDRGEVVLEACSSRPPKAQKLALKQTTDTKDHNQTSKKNVSDPKPAREIRHPGLSVQTATKQSSHVGENELNVKAAPLQLYKPPHQRQLCEKTSEDPKNGSEVFSSIKIRKESLFRDTKELVETKSSGRASQAKNEAANLPKFINLPSKCITSGMKADVYVSHWNSPLSFYVQLVREEDGICSLVEKLNEPLAVPQTVDVTHVQPGDLVQAVFPDDSSWYRAVVKEIHSNGMMLVEFVDFGNTAMLSVAKIAHLDKYFLELPAYSTQCMLSNATALVTKEDFDLKMISSEDIIGNGEKLLECQFVKQSGSIWEVTLEDEGVNVICKLSTRCATDDVGINVGKVEQAKEKTSDTRQMSDNTEFTQNNFLHCYPKQEFLEGQKFKVCITAVNDTLRFWCRPVDSEFVKLASDVSKVGDADHKDVDLDTLTPSSPCIALLSDSLSWCRAEVIQKSGDKLSVRFVDYGNISQVSVADLVEMPTHLMESPPKAILCELQGFSDSCGAWDSGAADYFSELTSDKVLELTITKVTTEEGTLKCFVHMELEAQVINETMKTWWKTSTTEVIPSIVAPTASYEPVLQCHSTMKDKAPLEDQLEFAESCETDTALACFQPWRDHSDEQSDSDVVDIETAATLEPGRSNHSDDYDSESTAEFQEEKRDQINSEGRMITEIQTPRMTEMSNDSNSEDVNTPSVLVSGVSAMEESMVLTLEEKGGAMSCHKIEVETDGDTEEVGDLVMETLGPDPLRSLLDESLVENLAESPLGEEPTDSVESSFDVTNFSEPSEQRDAASRDTFVEEHHLDVKTVPHEEDCSRDDSKDLKQIQTELELSSCKYPAFDSLLGQDTDAADVVPEEEVPQVTAPVQHELMARDTLDYYEDRLSVSSADLAAAGDPDACRDPTQGLVDGVGGFIHADEEARLIDICTDEASDATGVSVATDDCYLSKTAEELGESLLPWWESTHEPLIAEPHDNEPQAHTEPCPDLISMVEEVTSLVRQISLTDDSGDSQQSETKASDQPVSTPPSQTGDAGDGELKDGFVSADDFEVQLMNITHLTLKVNRWSADAQPDLQQEEE